MKSPCTLREVNEEQYNALELLYAKAIDAVTDPGYVRCAPPPEDKSFAKILIAWGMEMFRAGIDVGFKICDGANEDISINVQ